MTDKNKIIAFFLAFFLFSSMLCVGCNNRQKKAGTTPQQSGIQKIVVTDSLERQIEIPDKIERIREGACSNCYEQFAKIKNRTFIRKGNNL